jgi:tetratricopeptide (TPR) repeat protein
VNQDEAVAQAFQSAVAFHEQDRLDEAAQLYATVLTRNPDHFECLHHFGVLRAQQGRLDEAMGLLKQALALGSPSAETLNHAGAVLHALKRHREALTCFERALALDPGDAEAHYNRGAALQALGSHEAAIASYEEALAIEPDIPAVRYNLGIALQALNRYDDASTQYAKALIAQPGYVQAHAALGDISQMQGRYEDAIEHYDRAIAIDPEFAAAYERKGSALQALDRHADAIPCYERALALEPAVASTLDRLGIALQAVNRYEEAVTLHEKALAISPANAAAHNNLGLALQVLNRNADAIVHHQKALALQPGFSAAQNNLGRAFQALNRHDEAIAQYQVAIVNGPEHAARYANLGMALQEIGDLEGACRAFTKAIERAPTRGQFYRNLADCKRFTAGDPQLGAMEDLARNVAALSKHDRRQLLFALGKAFADLGQPDRSFGYFLEGNALKREEINYDEEKVLAEFARIREAFSAELMAGRRNLGDPSSVPVFILGMPRSGTTLVEQMLASHSRVFGAGELPDFARAVARLNGPVGAPGTFPEVVPFLSGDQLRALGGSYLKATTPAATQAARITDKMPLNFYYAGLIHLALPNARIIHTSRDPIDTCFSCFATLFTGAHRVAYELGELGRYYRAYERLMDHWHTVLPKAVLLDVQYEDLIADFESQARRIVAFCGLEWEDACLDFHKTRRPVRTASAAQVRRPIYQSSIGRWLPYKHLLGPLLDALSADAVGGRENT